MKTKAAILVVVVLVISTAVIFAAGKSWFDRANCDYCKNFLDEKGLMEHISKWEHHNVKNGAVTITVIDPEYIPAFKRAMGKMQDVASKEMAGEEVKTCGMCDAYSSIYAHGAEWDVVESGDMIISLLWSSNPEVVAEIHAAVDRTNKELALISKMNETGEMNKAKMQEHHKEKDHK